jgi:triacylglycerol lipase
MPTHSALARIQQFTTLSLAAASIGWAVLLWPRGPRLALGGALAIALSHLLLLALQFTLMVAVGLRDAEHRPNPRQVLRAWIAEAWYAAWVFGWRQPFAWRRVPDWVPATAQGRTGIVFVHGFACNRGFWAPWMTRARALGIPCIAVNLEPVLGSIDGYAPIIDNAVRRLQQATGRPPLLVCHSMGGLAARAWLRASGAPSRVAHVVTIGSPHHGTWLARFSRSDNGRQMQQASAWLRELAQHTATLPAGLITCWYTNCDNVVFPARTAMLPGADNRFAAGAAHVDLAFHPEVMAQTFALLKLH